MRSISAALQQAQNACDPFASVSVVQELRGWGPDTNSLCWSNLVEDSGGTPKDVAAAVRSDGQVLRFVNTGLAVNQERIADPTSAANWSTPTATTQVIVSAVGAIAVATDGSEIRLFYADGTAIKYISSTDDGATWSSAVTVASGLAAQPIDLHAAYYGGWTHGDWVVGCSIDTGSGVYRARFFYWDSSAWQSSELALDDWRMAGLGEQHSAGSIVAYAFDSDGEGTTRLAAGFGQPAWSLTRAYLDRTHGGLFGLNTSWYYVSALAGGHMCLVGELGYDGGGGGNCLGSMFEQFQLTEPVYLPGLDIAKSGPFTAFVDAGGRSYIVQDEAVWECVPRSVTGQSVVPIKYTYDEGKIELEFSGDVEAIEVGNILAITRTLEYLTQEDSETFRVLVTSVDAGWAKVKVTAYDALGLLGVFRARRDMVLAPNRSGYGTTFYVVEGICGRAGVDVAMDYEYIESVADSLNFTLRPGESLAGALYRAGSQHRVFLVPRNDGTFRLMAIPATYDQSDSDFTSSSGDYETDYYDYGPDDHPLIDARAVSDALRPAAVYVLGMASTDPEDGSRVGHALGPWAGCVRPSPISISNRFLNSGTKIDNAADSEARRQEMEGIDAVIESVANLVLELYDRVRVTDSRHGWTDKEFRVRRIRERWEKGRLTQVVYLGDLAYESSD